MTERQTQNPKANIKTVTLVRSCRSSHNSLRSNSVLGQNNNNTQRTASPLDIVGMPGYEKLETNENELCAIVRLVPEAYLEFKNLLMNECKIHGCLKLAQARSLIKIDVNKTRKLYDFLLSASLINKDPI
ncbi:hypothetical protein ScPMuIL_008101 [Solemya velum]